MTDDPFRDAVSAIDAGDVPALERLLAAHPALVRDRLDGGEGYFRNPYLLWFVAENPIRNGRLPPNIVEVTRALLAAAREMPSYREQVDYALALVTSGRVPRECGVQLPLIDLLLEAGADPDGALVPALVHHEVAAVEHLLARGARLTLTAAVCMDRLDEVELSAAGTEERQEALAAAALWGRPDALARLIESGADVRAYAPAPFHPHATPLHHAVDSGSLETVQRLVTAGADRTLEDRIHHGTPLDWAEYLARTEIAEWLRRA